MIMVLTNFCKLKSPPLLLWHKGCAFHLVSPTGLCSANLNYTNLQDGVKGWNLPIAVPPQGLDL